MFVIIDNLKFAYFVFQSPLTVTLPSPEPLTAAMFLFLMNMKEPGKGPLSPKLLFNQLCQKYDALFLISYFFFSFVCFFFVVFSITSSVTLAWTGLLFRWHVVTLLRWCRCLSFTCFQSVLLRRPRSPARHRQHLVPSEKRFNVHETQPTTMNGFLFLFSTAACSCCATCAIFDLDQG